MTQHTPAGLPEKIQHFIDGALVDSIGGETFDVLNPVTNETYIQAAAGQQADIDAAVAAAKRAFDNGPWPRMSVEERSRYLLDVAERLKARHPELAEAWTTQVGAPISFTRYASWQPAEPSPSRVLQRWAAQTRSLCCQERCAKGLRVWRLGYRDRSRWAPGSFVACHTNGE